MAAPTPAIKWPLPYFHAGPTPPSRFCSPADAAGGPLAGRASQAGPASNHRHLCHHAGVEAAGGRACRPAPAPLPARPPAGRAGRGPAAAWPAPDSRGSPGLGTAARPQPPPRGEAAPARQSLPSAAHRGEGAGPARAGLPGKARSPRRGASPPPPPPRRGRRGRAGRQPRSAGAAAGPAAWRPSRAEPSRSSQACRRRHSPHRSQWAERGPGRRGRAGPPRPCPRPAAPVRGSVRRPPPAPSRRSRGGCYFEN